MRFCASAESALRQPSMAASRCSIDPGPTTAYPTHGETAGSLTINGTSLHDPLACLRTALNPIAGAGRWTRPMAARADPVPRR